jgi:hypothetical protein
MLVSVIILMVLSIVFSFLAFGTIRRSLARSRASAIPDSSKFRFRHAVQGTLDDLFRAVLIFCVAVIVSCFVFRYSTVSHFDSIMADTLSMVCATTVVILCAAYWSNARRPRFYVASSMAIVIVLTCVLFGTHFQITRKPGDAIERYCSNGSGHISPDGSWADLGRRYVSVAFACWCVAMIGAVFHHPGLRHWRPQSRGCLHGLWVVAAALATISGVVSLGFYSWYFWKTFSIMKEVYGTAFTNTVFKWGFGQYLALATWAAPILHFFHIWLGCKYIPPQYRNLC